MTVTSSTSRTTFLLLAIITIIAAILRALQLGESLWLDELHSSWCVSGNWSEVAGRARMGNQSPFYFWLLKLWISIIGQSEITLRLPSLIASTLLLPIAATIVFRIAPKENWLSGLMATTAAVLLAIIPIGIFFGQETRPYALVQLCAAIHLLALLTTIKSPTMASRSAMVIAAALSIHFHPTAALMLIAEAIVLVPMLLSDRARHYRLSMLAVDVMVGLLLLSPQLSLLLDTTARRENWSRVARPVELFDARRFVMLFPGTLLAIVAGIVALIATYYAKPDGSDCGDHWRTRRSVAMVLTAAILPMLVAWISSASGVAHLWMPRYLVASILPITILVSLVSWPVARWKWLAFVASGLAVALVVFQSGIIPKYQQTGRLADDRREDWRSLVEAVSALPEDERPTTVYLSSGLIEAREILASGNPASEAYLNFPLQGLYQIRKGNKPLRIIPFEHLRVRQLAKEDAFSDRSCCVIIRGSPEAIEQMLIHPSYQKMKNSFDREATFGSVTLFRHSRDGN